MKTVEKKVYELVLPYADEHELEIYDVIYEKQGKDMYLSIYIDKKDGVSIEDCEELNRYIDPILDEQLEIKEQYFLEVSSPGLERRIRLDEHYRKYLDTMVQINLYKPINKSKQHSGILKKYDSNTIVLLEDDAQNEYIKDDIALIKTVYDWENIKEVKENE